MHALHARSLLFCAARVLHLALGVSAQASSDTVRF